MRKLLIVGALLGLTLALPSGTAQAGIPIFYKWDSPAVKRVADLPDTPSFQLDEDYADLGWSYRDYSLFGLSVWTSDDLGYIYYFEDSGGFSYVQVDPADLPELATLVGMDMPDTYSLSPWDRFSGWLIVLALVGYIAFRIKHAQLRAAAQSPPPGGP